MSPDFSGWPLVLKISLSMSIRTDGVKMREGTLGPVEAMLKECVVNKQG